MFNYDYGYDYTRQYEGYENDEYYSVNEVLENMDNETCTPSIIETITEQDEETGEFKETKVYNCNNCTNYECQYFYDIE